MIKNLIVVMLLIMHATIYVSCSKENEPDVMTPEVPEKPDDGNGGNTSDSDDNPNLNVIVSADGSTSNGVQFRRIDGTSFMLNYVRYKIVDGHISVVGRDDVEIEQTLNGHVDIVRSITIDGVKYIVRSIGNRSFEKSEALREISIPSTVVTIGSYVFYQSFLEKVSMANVVSIDDYAFAQTRISKIDLPESLNTIGAYVFYQSHLEEVSMYNSKVVSIDDYAFAQTKISKIDLPESLNTIGRSAFQQTDIIEIELPKGLSSIGDYAFYKTKLKTIKFTDEVEKIGKYAFACTDIETVKIPSSIYKLDLLAFAGCQNLKKVYLSPNLKSLYGSFISYTDYNERLMLIMEELYLYSKVSLPELSYDTIIWVPFDMVEYYQKKYDDRVFKGFDPDTLSID